MPIRITQIIGLAVIALPELAGDAEGGDQKPSLNEGRARLSPASLL